jgi:hypothetical protein
LNKIGPWNESLDIWQDTEFAFRVLALKIPGLWMNEILVLERYSEDGIMNRDVMNTSEAMLHTTNEIEEVARRLGIFDKELSDICGRRLATISRILASGGDWNKSGKLFLEARRRMTLINKLIHSFHRLCMRAFGTSTMKRLRLM